MYVEQGRAKCFESLSLMVSQILDQITASEEVRQLWMKIGTSRDSLDDLMAQLINTDYHVYLMGSAFEGTRTPGMKSDIDFLLCNEKFIVVQNKREANNHSDCLLLVQDNHTKPGYVKLQLVQDGMPVFKIVPLQYYITSFTFDCYGRAVCIRDKIKGLLTDEYHGPAETESERPLTLAADRVQAYRCQTWPEMATSWFSRKRKFKWPSENMIRKFKSLGFFVVPVGHPNSPEKDREWRISLSLQERLLMQSLNTTQFQCYVLLKLIKKDVISYMVNGQSLTSYHLKTCLFYSIEESPAEFWKPPNLLLCLRKCLDKLYAWVRNKSCPNYFIPEENMFEGRIEGALRARVEHALNALLMTDFHYLLYIKCDTFNKLLRQFCLRQPIMQSNKVGKQKIQIIHGELNVLSSAKMVLMLSFGTDLNEAFNSSVAMSHVVRKVRSTNRHSEQDISKARSLLLPYIEQFIMSSAVAFLVEKKTKPVSMVNVLLSEAWDGLCSASDCASAKLKQATYLNTFGYYNESLAVVEKVVNESVSEQNVPIFMSVCKCRNGSFHEDLTFGEELGLSVQHSNISDSGFRKRYWAPCVIFCRHEMHLIPQALQYEMQRSVGMPHETKLPWYDWATVDSRILMYFLNYLNFHKLGNKQNSLVELTSMAYSLLADPNLGHKETGLNLLGWALYNENYPYMALEIFQLSLVLKRQHNVAVWLLGRTLLTNRSFPKIKSISVTDIEMLLMHALYLLRDFHTKFLFKYSSAYILHEDCYLYRQDPNRPVPSLDDLDMLRELSRIHC